MAANSDWFGKLKSRAKSVQETAKTKLEKLSETVDKKLKEAQEDLEKQRSKADTSAAINPQLQRWRPSTDNPDGEIVSEVKPPPVVQPTTLTTPESSPASTPVDEPITIKHKGKRRPAKRNSLASASSISVDPENDLTNEERSSHIKQNDNREEIILCLNDIISQITDREIVDKGSNKLIDKISTVDELVKSTASNAMPQKGELISVQDTTNHFENNMDGEKEDSVSSKTENTPTAKLTPMTSIDDSSDVPPDPENISINSPIEHSSSENIPMKTPDDEVPALTNTDKAPIEQSDSESIPANTSDDELPITKNIADLSIVSSSPENVPISITHDEIPPLMNIESSGSDNIQIHTPIDEVPTTTNTADSSITSSGSENILMNIAPDTLATDESGPKNVLMEILDDDSPTLTNVDEIAIVHDDLENMSINISDDEMPASTNIDKSPIESTTSENIPIITLIDEVPTTITNIANSPIANSGPENIPGNISDDESPTLTTINNPPSAHSVPENIQMEISDDELSTSTDTEDSPNENFGLENLPINMPDDELPTTTNIENSPIVESGSKILPIKIPDDELFVLTNVDDIVVVDPDLDKISICTSDEDLLTSVDIDDTPLEHSDANDNDSITSENNIKTPPNELEDSFDELKIPNIPVHRPPEEPSQKLTHLAALRDFISKIEDDVDEDEEVEPSKQDTNILEKSVNITPEQRTPSNIVTKTLSSSSNSMSDEAPENMVNETRAPSDSLSDEPSNEETNESISTMSIDTKSLEKKRYPVVNCHPIPPGTQIYHTTCSSTYIYICTINGEIFYAKLNLNDIDYPFKWLQHSDSAERIVVSVSNRTVWRLFNKHVYISNDPVKFPPLGSHWNEISINNGKSLLSMSINDQCGWYIKDDGTLWLIRTDDKTYEPLNVACPFNLNTVFCFSEKVGVTTSDGEILIRVGCTDDCLEGDGWIFIEHNFGPIDDFILLTNNNMIAIVDKKHHLWIHQWSSDKGFYEILCNDEFLMSRQRYLISVNADLLCFTDCEEQIHVFSDCLTGVQWTVIEKNTRLQRLIGAFSNEDYVWALTTDKMISSSNGHALDKPRQAQYLTHATFVPNHSSQDAVLWTLDESCCIYVRANVQNGTHWEQVDRSQFEWNRRLVNIVCNHAGVWAVDDQGYIHFRHGHISASQTIQIDELSFLPPAWIPIPGEPKRHRCFSQVYCGPADWMVYATDNKQNVYTREGINEENRIGTSWKLIEDCSALELAISDHTLWLLTSHGNVQCRENISVTNPIGTRSTTLPGFFLSLTVSMDDSQVWALDSKRNLLKLDRLTVLFEK